MKYLTIFVLLGVLAFVGCETFNNDPMSAEHIIMPYPIPESGWEELTRKDRSTEWNRWQKGNEFLSLAITRKSPKQSVKEQRDGVDSYARDEIAKSFDSVVILQDRVGIADRLIWKTEIEFKNRKKAYSIFVLLHGNDASYFITKQWDNLEEFNQESNKWLDYLKTIEVKDPRLAL